MEDSVTMQTARAETPRAVIKRLRRTGRIYATTSETAKVLGYDRRTIIDGIEAGQIPAIRILTTWRIPVEWIMAQPGIPDGGADAAA
jgi:excisionase family DNA binding protein